MPETSLIPRAACVSKPWKNGGGVTREIYAGPPGATLDGFDWRVSVADIAQPGPFSRFDGVDRTLVLLAGAGMTLRENGGAEHVLGAPLDMLRFAGETGIDATLANGPTRDLNVMVRRGRASADVSAQVAPARFETVRGVTLIHCVQSRISVAAGGASHTLEPGDTLRIDSTGGEPCSVACADAQWLRIEIALHREDSPR